MVKTVAFARQSPMPVQQRLQHKRRSVRRRMSPPASQKKQSTLTQIDFIPTPMQRQYTIPESSEEEEEEEYSDSRPAKKRKSVGRKKAAMRSESQSTLTQKWDQPRASGIVVDDSDEDIAPGSESEPIHYTTGMTAGLSAQSARMPSPSIGAHIVKQQDNTMVTAVADSVGGSQNSDVRTRDASVTHSAEPSTPQTIRKEVPSSETPSSIKLSMSLSPRSRRTIDRSPLAKRSTNIPSKFSTRCSSPPQLQLKRERSPAALDEATAISPQNTSTRPRFKTPSQEVTSLASHSSTAVPIAGLNRLSTIQDSQDENAGGLEEVKPRCDGTEDRQWESTYATTQYQLTYDPVSAALDRDAARFAQRTQMQNVAYVPEEVERDIEESEQQLLREFHAPYGSSPRSVVHTNAPISPISSSQDLNVGMEIPSAVIGISERLPSSEDVDRTVTIPDSPCLASSTRRLRPSQISTVVSSPTEPRSRTKPPSHCKRDTLPEDPSSMIWQETLSSPTILARDEQEGRTTDTADGNGTAFTSDWTDYSLPPPPFDVTG